MSIIEGFDGNDVLYGFTERAAQFSSPTVGESMTVQADAEDADINTIVRRFGLTGTMPVGLHVPSYQDYDGVFDFHSAQLALLDAEANFMAMPAHIRGKFDNDPGKFLQFAVDPANVDAMVEMGLAVKKVETVVSSVENAAPPKTE